ncbi:MAG: hypothetical protein CM1200mP10_29390 [Candidatus Neomarinimicrobiota bacterium]|nr:MAG: hypothetical protein CM1200mP10_29390 [Candidatus Neomarinimicrobiota bacterium]
MVIIQKINRNKQMVVKLEEKVIDTKNYCSRGLGDETLQMILPV